jgi:hypothetical protein
VKVCLPTSVEHHPDVIVGTVINGYESIDEPIGKDLPHLRASMQLEQDLLDLSSQYGIESLGHSHRLNGRRSQRGDNAEALP